MSKVLSIAGEKNPLSTIKVNIKSFFAADKDPYQGQLDAFKTTEELFENPDKSVGLLKMPTAAGKSPTEAAIAKAWISKGGIAYIMTINKQLQQQLIPDFVDLTVEGGNLLSVIMGASEYQCKSFASSCENVKARRGCSYRKISEQNVKDKSSECPYRMQFLNAMRNLSKKPLCVTPQSFMAIKGNPLYQELVPEGNGLLLIDEAHQLQAVLREQLSLNLDISFVEEILGPSPFTKGFQQEFSVGAKVYNDEESGLNTLVMAPNQMLYLLSFMEELEDRTQRLYKLIKGFSDEVYEPYEKIRKKSLDEQLDILEKENELLSKVKTLYELIDKKDPGDNISWIAEFNYQDKKLFLTIKPDIIPNSYLRRFFKGFSKVIFLSGTFFDTYLELLGLKSDDPEDPYKEVVTLEVESRIAPSRRRINIDQLNGMAVNTSNVKKAFEQFAKVIINDVADKMPGEKGLIHVSSNAQLETFIEIAQRLVREKEKKDKEPSHIRFINPNIKGWKESYKEFINTKMDKDLGGNVYLVAARRFEGLDLKDDLARINIMLKAPIPDSRNIMVQALNHKFPGYKATTILTDFIQAMNRTTRNPKDGSLIICFDLVILNYLQQFGQSLPVSTQDAIELQHEENWIRRFNLKIN